MVTKVRSYQLIVALLFTALFLFSSTLVLAAESTERCVKSQWFNFCIPIPPKPTPFPRPSILPLPWPIPPQFPIKIGAALGNYRQPFGWSCNINVPAQFSTIQAGINAAVSGNTVCVGAGTYNEDVLVNKSIRLSGSGTSLSTINGHDASMSGTVDITANNVTLEGFLIKGIGTQTTVVIEGSDQGPVSKANLQYNRLVAGNGGIALETIRVQNSVIQNSILEGNNSPYIAKEGGLDGVGSLNISFINNTFIGTVSPNTRSDTGITLDAETPHSLIKQNVFNTTGPMTSVIAANNTSVINQNNFNSGSTIKVAGTAPLNAENNWWGDTDPSDNAQSGVDFTPFSPNPFIQN